MLTAEDNDLLCRVEGDAPMGRLMRAPLDSRLPVGGSRGARRRAGARAPPRRGARRLPRQRRAARRAGRALPAPPRVARARPQRGMRAALPLPRLEDRRRRQHRRPPVGAAREAARSGGTSTGPIRAARPAASSGCGWAIRPRRRRFEPPAWAPTPDIRTSIVKMHVNCNWAQVLEGAIDSAHSSSLHSTDMVPATRRRRRRRPRRSGCARRPTRRRGCRCERTAFGFRYVAIRHPIENAATHDYLRITLFVAPFTVLIPPNDRYNLSILNIPQDDTHTMFYFIAWSDGRGHRPGRVAQVLRRARSASTSTRNSGSIRTRDNDYLQDRQAMRAGSHTGHRRHSEPGHGDVGDDGADRRPIARAARRERRRHRPVPPDHGRGRAHGARRRPRDRHRSRRACPTSTLRVVRGDRAEDDRLDDARRRGRRARAPGRARRRRAPGAIDARARDATLRADGAPASPTRDAPHGRADDIRRRPR